MPRMLKTVPQDVRAPSLSLPETNTARLHSTAADRRSKQMTTEKKAKKAHKRTRGSGCLYQRGRVWWMSASTDYGSFRESTGKTTKGEAQAQLNTRLGELQRGTHSAGTGRTTVEMLIDDVKRDYRNN